MFSECLVKPRKRDALDNIFEEIKQLHKPIVVFGCGSLAKEGTRRIENAGMEVDAYCEGAEFYKPGKSYEGKKVINIADLHREYKECALILAATGDNVADYIKKFNDDNSFMCDIYAIYDKDALYEMDYNWLYEHRYEFDKTYNILEDEESRKVFLAYIDAKANCIRPECIGDDILYRFWRRDQYFNQLYPEKCFEKHVLLDCGAYIGDTALTFLDYLKDTGKDISVYAFEPDDDNYMKLKKESEKDGRIIAFHYGVGEKTEKLYFEMVGKSSSKQVSYKTDHMIDVVNVDELFQKKNIDTYVSMVKMDLEGAEIAALKGMRQLIKKNMPMLAICVYHKADDLIEIPKLISDMEKEAHKDVRYKYYLRHHSNTVAELVFYAVPEPK